MQKRILGLAGLGMVASLCAFGDTVTQTEWQISNQSGGTLTYAGSGAALKGVAIPVTQVQGQDLGVAVASPAQLTIIGGELNFISGLGIGAWDWTGTGGDLTVTGCIAATGSFAGLGTITGGNCTAAATLVDDSFTEVYIDGSGHLKFGKQTGTFTGVSLEGTIDASIASYFGVSPVFTSPDSDASFAVAGLPAIGGSTYGAALTSGVTTGIGDLNLVAAVPEGWHLSSSLGVFAFGLIVLGVARRRGVIKPVSL